MSERIAVYPGSFDPVTYGHLDILDRAAAIFDRVIVGVLENPGKTPLFTAAERVELIRACLESRPTIDVMTFDGLTVDFAATTGAIAIVRGLRVVSDFESEFQMALMNRRLNPAVNTVFLMTSFSNVFISSSLIKEVCHLGGNVSEMAPPVSVEAMQRRFAVQRERKVPSHVSERREGIDPTVIDLVDQLEELVSTGRRVPFTSGVVVNEDELLELIDRIRLGLPDELMQARHLLEDQRRVLAEAEQEAERILSRADGEVARITDEAQARAAVMVGDHALVDQAREQASTVIAEAAERAAKTCSDADAYAREVMLRLEDQLMRAATTVRKGIDALPAEGGSRRKRRERE